MKIRIVDHKTTGKIALKETTPVDLANDPQMLTYAESEFRQHPEAAIEVAHNTISTKHKARVLPLEWVPVSRERSRANWNRQVGVVRKMLALAAAPPADWNDVPCNTNACQDFGGCDFLSICALKTPTIGVTKMAHDEVGASDLLARLAALAPAPSVAVQAPPTITVTPVAIEAIDVSLLPPDAPTRMTPMPEAEAEPEKPAKGKRSKRAAAPSSTAPGAWQYVVDKVLETTENIEAYLNAKGADGWELVGFYDGIYAVFKRASA